MAKGALATQVSLPAGTKLHRAKLIDETDGVYLSLAAKGQRVAIGLTEDQALCLALSLIGEVMALRGASTKPASAW